MEEGSFNLTSKAIASSMWVSSRMMSYQAWGIIRHLLGMRSTLGSSKTRCIMGSDICRRKMRMDKYGTTLDSSWTD
jgi:hypothetical protein